MSDTPQNSKIQLNEILSNEPLDLQKAMTNLTDCLKNTQITNNDPIPSAEMVEELNKHLETVVVTPAIPTQNLPQISIPHSNETEKMDILGLFIFTLEKFLKTLNHTFPECTALPDFRRKLDLAKLTKSDEKVIRKWHDELKSYYTHINAKDKYKLGELHEKCSYFRDLKILEKMNDPGFTQAHQDITWKYLIKLCNFSKIYCEIPSNMMKEILKTAQSLQKSVENGGNLKNLDLMEIGRSVVQNLTEKDTSEFASNLPNLFSSISQLGSINPKEFQSAILNQGKGINAEAIFRPH